MHIQSSLSRSFAILSLSLSLSSLSLSLYIYLPISPFLHASLISQALSVYVCLAFLTSFCLSAELSLSLLLICHPLSLSLTVLSLSFSIYYLLISPFLHAPLISPPISVYVCLAFLTSVCLSAELSLSPHPPLPKCLHLYLNLSVISPQLTLRLRLVSLLNLGTCTSSLTDCSWPRLVVRLSSVRLSSTSLRPWRVEGRTTTMEKRSPS